MVVSPQLVRQICEEEINEARRPEVVDMCRADDLDPSLSGCHGTHSR